MDARGMRTPRRARTTFPSGSSRGCTCSLLLPAAPGSSRCSSQCGSRWTQVRLPVRLPPPSPARGPQWVPSPAWLPVQPPLPGASPRAMPRGRAWTQAEVGSLLALVGGSGEAALLMASTSRPNEALWQQISRGLAAAGYSRSVAQCRSKWKALKQAFHSERETRRRAGLHSPRLPPHYRAMKSIWKAAGRPVFRERRLLDLGKLPPRRRRSAPATCSPSSPVPPDSQGTLLSPLLWRVKDEPESSCGEHIAGAVPDPTAVLNTAHCIPLLPILGSHAILKQESAEQKAGFPIETSPGTGGGNIALPVPTAAPGSPRPSEQTAAGEDVPDASLQGCGVAGLLQSVQQLLVQILQTSRQQQALLESLASDTVSHLHLLSHSLVQVGETLHQLLLRPQAPPSHGAPHIPLFGGGPPVPLLSGLPSASPDPKEECRASPGSGCALP
ncbi:undifferentiated embryonic cell transcription factor 1 [Gallus gallus]|uniref:undifferentiated embryonic cell transcription factor 1 n=1 Tax=Gallus gallus TaxID=9031 RepID=UPI000350655D|nr:undifferentiated embryonic cell transcription factor 1 [Gallus gallus]XP_046792260.1 undifferentiated embryonic cell transcription factor 1 [Gallus gallus]|eukprot:XP_003642965.2 undifferentiated embryonic cell transcription factor 1 [Gallus gallus]